MKHNSKRKSLIRGEYLQSLKRTVSNLCCELKGIRDEAVILREHCGSLQRTGNMRNIRRRENRKQKRLALQEETINQLSSENKQLRIAVQKVEKNFQESKKKSALKIARIRKRFSKKKKQYKARIRRFLRAKHAVYSSNSSDYSSDEENHVATIATLDRGHYNSKVRECCMQLLAHNVGIHNVRACIKAVCDLVGCELDHLPSKSTLANMMVEARAISHLQLADRVPAFNTNMLHSDGTTKFGNKYGGLQVSTPDSCYTLCLTSMKAGGASNFKDLLVNVLSDVSDTCQAVGKDGASLSKRILGSIKNTMSDRHVVEKKFNELLELYRAEILPDIVEGWSTFTPEQQLSFTRMNNFFCGLHFLIGLADSSAEGLKSWEALVLDEDAVTGSEPGTIRLIRTTCKAVQKHCSQLAGCHVMFKAYLQSQGVSIFPIDKFQGNRFNIIFHNAAGIYYLRTHLIRYLEQIHPSLNQLLQAVLRDVKNPYYITGCCALGIISKCITAPLWRLLESVNTMSELGRKIAS